MADSLIEAFKNARNRHTTGSVHLVCLDDEDLPESEYGSLGMRTIVPRANKEGGIMGLVGDDSRYGKGVTRREVNMTESGFVVEEEKKNFRPDDNRKEQELPEDPVAVLQDAILGNPGQPEQPPAPQPQGVNAMASNQPSEMMQMMQMLMQMMGQNGNGNGNGSVQAAKPEPPPPEPPKPERKPTTSVTFGGDFGRFTAPYASARVEPGFILLATAAGDTVSYEPPISPVVPLQVTIDGETHRALNVGLSFEYKGDIVTIMPLKAETPDDA